MRNRSISRTSVSESTSDTRSAARRGEEAAVAADVEVPPVLGGDHPEVLAPRLRALAGAPGHPGLDLVRRPQPAVTHVQLDRHGARVLHAVPAPGAAPAGLARAQRFPVGVAGLEPGVHEPAPDPRQLLSPPAPTED